MIGEKIIHIQPNPENVWAVYENEDGTQDKYALDAWVYLDDDEYPGTYPYRKGICYDRHGDGDFCCNDSNFLGYIGNIFVTAELHPSEYLPSKRKKK